jgi:hypothetical protein
MQHATASIESSPAIQIRLRKDLWSAVEGFRRNEPDIPTRPEAIRRLIQRALASNGERSPAVVL